MADLNDSKPVLDRASLSVLHAAHKDKTRYAMRGVFVDMNGFTSTDGKILAHVTHNGHQLPDVRCVNLDLDLAKDLVRAVGRGRKQRPFVVDDGFAVRAGESRELRTVDGPFPPYEEVIPQRRGPGKEIGLNASHLLRLLKAAVQFGGEDLAVRLSIDPDNLTKACLRFDAQGDGREFVGLIMPVSLCDEEE